MEVLGTSPVISVPIARPVQAAPVVARAVVPDPVPSRLPDPVTRPVHLDDKGTEQRRLEHLQEVAQSVANTYPLGDQRFTIYKDATGQYITRFTSLRDGKVTYIPEPELFKLHHVNTRATVNIEA